MPENENVDVNITQQKLDELTTIAERAAFKAVSAALERCAETIESMTVNAENPAARIGAEVALRKAASETRKQAAMYRKMDASSDD